MPSHTVVSNTPFITPSAQLTGQEEFPTEGEADSVVTKPKDKKKSRKSKKGDKDFKTRTSSPSVDKLREQKEHSHTPSQSKPPAPAQSTSGPGSVKQVKTKPMPVQTQTSTFPAPQDSATGLEAVQPGSTGQDVVHTQPSCSGFSDVSVTGSYRCPPEQDSVDFDLPHSDTEFSDDDQPEWEEGEVSSDNFEKPELTEDMTYRETVRSIRSFMGWDHIPPFESDLSEPDKSNNPWKGKAPKRPARVSVAMLPDDWLCQKLEKLNTVVAEGYLSHAQDSAGLKRDQFIKVPKTRSRWYQMHTIRTEGPHRPGKSLFSWANSEAKVNSQFPRITKASAYPSTGPPSRPISQEYLHRWEKSEKENSYLVNYAAGFNRCTSELQDCMNSSSACFVHALTRAKHPRKYQRPLLI